MKNSSPDGIHYLISFYGCQFNQINLIDFWKNLFCQLIEESSKMEYLHDFYYQFNPQGVSAFMMISASHFSVHTWPELNYAACDIFSCAPEKETKKLVDKLIAAVNHSHFDFQEIKRGYQVKNF